MKDKKRKPLPLIIVIAFMLIVIGVSPSLATDGWEINIVVSVGVAENRLSFGQRPDATDGVDGQYDVPAMLSGDVRAYFPNPDGKYWRDIKAMTPGAVKIWEINIESPLTGQMVEVKWKRELLPENARVNLIDNSAGAVIDMKAQGSYKYQNNGQRQLKVEVLP